MSDQIDQQLLRERSLAFFGSITASVSHELNNVISILDQSAGLLGDLNAGARSGRPIPEEKLEKIAESMQRQTQRGLGIIRRLNKFAHSVDLPDCEFDLSETVASLGALCTRLADMKSTALKLRPGTGPITVSGSPFLLQQWVFLKFRQMLAVAQKGDTIEIATDLVRDTARVFLQGPRFDTEADETAAETEQMLCTCLGAESDFSEDDTTITVRLIMPGRE